MGSMCLTVICHLETGIRTKLGFYIKLLVRPCLSRGIMTDLRSQWRVRERDMDVHLRLDVCIKLAVSEQNLSDGSGQNKREISR